MKYRLSKEQVLSKFDYIHKGKYRCKDFEYKGIYTKIEVECPEHGIYNTTIKSHMKHSCKRCYYKTIGKSKLMSIDEFIEAANKVHINKYDYSKVSYKKFNDIIEIICPNHGSFFQKRNYHLCGNGCQKCRYSKGERYIENFLVSNGIKFKHQHIFHDCRRINPLPFDFYLQDFNVCIEFDGRQHTASSKNDSFYFRDGIRDSDKIKTQYCFDNDITLIRIPYTVKNINSYLIKKLKKIKVMTTEEKRDRFIKKALELWGYKYDYSKVDYVDNTTPVSIGYKGYWYKQTPVKHLQGKKIEFQERRMSTEDFILKSKNVWGDSRFDYSDCEYLGNTKKIRLFDNIKNKWIEQSPKSHLKGYEVTKMSLEDFISECNEIYGDKFKITADNYSNLHSRVNLFCPYHGVIEKKASSILYSSACPECPESEFNKKIIDFLKYKSITYSKNHKFTDVKDNKCIRFDFYLPTLRTCIEFDGIQHFEPIEFFGGITAFERQKKNDNIKQSYCEENFIDLIRIRYDRIDSISDILWESLKFKILGI